MAFLSPSMITTMDAARKHRTYALWILIIVYIFNFIDRQIVNILQEDIKADLHLNDTQLGMMTGLAFAVVYCTMGIPVARIADSTSRKGVMVISLAIWSAFTALCGLANPIHIGTFTISAFVVLLITRMGVGLGEAGGSPPAHAMISDLYEKEKRGRALALYSAGLYAGTLLGYYLGGWLSEALNWRQAFFVVGIPGVIFAIIAWTTVREPVRGLSGSTPSTDKPTFLKSFAKLWSLKAFPYYAIATGAGTFITYGLGNWMPSFMPRTYGVIDPATIGSTAKYIGMWSMPELQNALGMCQSTMVDGVKQLAADCYEMNKTEIGLFYGTCSGVGGMIGTIAGGYFADRLGAKDRRWFLWVPMWGKIIGAPLFILAMLAPTVELSLLLYFPGITLAAMYLGPSLAITHHLVPASMRAMSSAVLFFILNILGLGTGPFVVGIMSDWISGNAESLSQAHSFLGDSVDQVKQMSLKWAMIIAVILMTPLALLWHIGAMKLPKGELTDEGDAVKEALTEGDPTGSSTTVAPKP
ncbi:MAG TPA: MFS transporter [Hyphomonadaceae bacterium]|nr:MFS transporter [Hyphomonadaceae bacterium]HPI49925.1 MFS transporter [Hyphomonadaceae bacterium]